MGLGPPLSRQSGGDFRREPRDVTLGHDIEVIDPGDLDNLGLATRVGPAKTVPAVVPGRLAPGAQQGEAHLDGAGLMPRNHLLEILFEGAETTAHRRARRPTPEPFPEPVPAPAQVPP